MRVRGSIGSEVPSLARRLATAIGSMPLSRSAASERLPVRFDSMSPAAPAISARWPKTGTGAPRASKSWICTAVFET